MNCTIPYSVSFTVLCAAEVAKMADEDAARGGLAAKSAARKAKKERTKEMGALLGKDAYRKQTG